MIWKKYLALVKKDIKNLFRNWTSIFILVIGPLILMLILILAFSEMGFYNINIGYIDPGNSFDSIKGQIDYLGNFIKYDSLEECKDDLKEQRLHLCIDVNFDDVINVDLYFDNTREVMSLILTSQIRRGIERQKDIELKGKTYSIINDLKQVRLYMNEKQKSIDSIIKELEGYKTEINDMRNNLNLIISQIDKQISQLEMLRNDIFNIKYQSNDYYDNVIINTRTTANEALNELNSARNAMIMAGQSTQEIEQAINSLHSLNDNINNLDFIVSGVNNNIDQATSKMDDTLASMREARQFLEQADQRLGDIYNSLISRINELNTINKELEDKKKNLIKVESMDVDLIVNPFLLNLKPLFEGSERAKRLANDISSSLSQEKKEQLLSIGSVQTLLPLVISLMICFISVIISVIIILDEKGSPAYVRNQISPLPWSIMIISILTTVLMLLVIQVGIILGMGYGVFIMDMGTNLLVILLVSVILILTYSFLGMGLGYIINSPTTSLLVASFFLIINIFLSGIVFPVERMSRIMIFLSSFIPFREGVSILQQTLFYQIPFGIIKYQILRLVGLMVLSVIFLIVSYNIYKVKYRKGVL